MAKFKITNISSQTVGLALPNVLELKQFNLHPGRYTYTEIITNQMRSLSDPKNAILTITIKE